MSAISVLRRGSGLLSALVALLPASTPAQLAPASSRQGTHVELALAKPFMDGLFEELGFASTLLHGRIAFPAGQRATVFVETGLATATIESERSTTLGNLSVGAALGREEGVSGVIALTLPTAREFGDDDFATGLGLLGDPEHIERFLPDAYALEGEVSAARRWPYGGTLGVRFSGVVIGSTEEGADTELFTRYGLSGALPLGAVLLGGEISGYAIVSEGDLDFGERTVHQLAVRLGLPGAGGAPELFLRLPIDDDLRDHLKATVGLRVGF